MKYPIEKALFIKNWPERRHFVPDIGRVGREQALEKWVAMGGEVVADDEVDWV